MRKDEGLLYNLGIVPVRDVNCATVDKGWQLLNINCTTKFT